MKRAINPEQFESIIKRLTERMEECIKTINHAVVEGNSLLEKEARTRLASFDLTVFLITLHSSIVDEKESV